MDARGHLERDAIDEFYNKEFKKNCTTTRYKVLYIIGNHKRSRFLQAPKSCSLLYTPIAYLETTNQDLVWLDFEEFYALITGFKQLEACAFQIYLDLTHFL
jgi:hypothetical protein